MNGLTKEIYLQGKGKVRILEMSVYHRIGCCFIFSLTDLFSNYECNITLFIIGDLSAQEN